MHIKCSKLPKKRWSDEGSSEMMFSMLFVSIISLTASVISMIIAHKTSVVAHETAELNRVLADRYATLADLAYQGHAAISRSGRESRPLRG